MAIKSWEITNIGKGPELKKEMICKIKIRIRIKTKMRPQQTEMKKLITPNPTTIQPPHHIKEEN